MGNRQIVKNIKFILKATYLGHFLVDFYITMIPPILYIFGEKLSLTLAQQGLVSALIIVSGSIFQPIFGYFADNKSSGRILLISVLWIGIFYSLTGVINNYYLLLIIVFLGAIASSIYHPLGSALTIELSDKSKGKSLSKFLVLGSLAMPAAPIIVLPLTNKFGLNGLAYLIIPCLLGVIFMYFSGLHKLNIEQDRQEERSQKLKLDIYKLKWLVLLILIPTMRNIIFRTLITFGMQYLALKSIGLGLAGFTVTVLLLAEPAGTFIGGNLCDRYGCKNILTTCGILCIISAIFTFWSTGYISIVSMIILTIVISLSNTSTVLITHSLIPRNTNLATGLVFGLPMGLGGIGTFTFGKFADLLGLVTAAKYLLIPVILMVCIIFIIPKEWKE